MLTKELLHSILKHNRQSTMDSIKAERVVLSAHGAVEKVMGKILALPSAGDLNSTVSLYRGYCSDEKARVQLFLRKDKKDTTLLREIVAAGIARKIEKTQGYSSEDLKATFRVGTVEFTIHGYVPSSCRIVEEEKIVPVKDVFLDDNGQVLRREKVRRIICGDDDVKAS